jgi:hypothetical protein
MSGLLVGLIQILPLALLGGRGELDSVRACDASWLLLLLLAGDVIVHYILHDVHCCQVFEGVAVCVCCRLLLLLLVTVEKQGAAPT